MAQKILSSGYVIIHLTSPLEFEYIVYFQLYNTDISSKICCVLIIVEAEYGTHEGSL